MANWVFTIGVSVRLSDRSLHREEEKKFVKNCPQWGLKPGPLDHQVNDLSTELRQHSVASLNLHGLKSCSIESRNEQSPICEVVHETKFISEISCPTDSCLAQLVRHWSEDPEVLVSILVLLFPVCEDLSDNLTETPIVKNSNINNYVMANEFYVIVKNHLVLQAKH